MKGLVIKDLMCLRKQRITFIYVMVATVVLAVMFVLSSRFGNLYLANQQMIADNQLSGIDVKNLSTMVLIVFMLLPIALVGDVATVFTYDGQAGFANVCGTLPLSINKRVMAKYVTVLILFGIGVGVDLLISLVLSLLTDIISFADFLGIILSAASVMSIYGFLTIFFCFVVGYGKESYAQSASLLIMGAVFIAANFKKIKDIFGGTFAGPDSSTGDLLYVNDFMEFLKHRFYLLLMLAVITMVISYFGTVTIAKRRRGMI